jgi:hypothetical protein
LAVALWLGGCGDIAGDDAESGSANRAGADKGGAFGNGPMASGTGGSSASAGSAGNGGSMNGASADAGVPVLPPEVETNIDFEQPQASERFVYAANPEAGTVSIIDAETQAIQTHETGDHPKFLRTLAGTDDAIVLNVGSDDATILRSPATTAKTSNVSVVHGANAIGVAPDGKHAVVYFDSGANGGAAPTGSVLQDVTVIVLADGEDKAIGMTIGFRPRDVSFSSDGKNAYVVTDDGISILDFTRIEKEGTGIARLVTLGSDIDQKALDVSVTPDGRYALAREPGKSAIRLVDLDSGAIREVDLKDLDYELGPGAPLPDEDVDAGAEKPGPRTADISDLDLAPDGKFALAAVRDHNAVVRIAVPGGFEKPSTIEMYTIPKEIVGSISIAPQSDRALIYTTAVDAKRLTELPLSGDEDYKTLALRKAVQAVAFAPDGDTALVIHKKTAGDPNEPGIADDVQIDRSFGYSVVRIESGAVKLQVTPVAPAAFNMVPDGSFLFLMLRNDGAGVREVQKVEAKSFLTQTITLGSPPVSLGSVPKSKRMFVNQEHPDGRITFIDWETNETRTVTGFELNSRIRD